MTIQQLSERICQAYEIEHHAGIPIYHDKFIVEDWSMLMPLAVENGISILPSELIVECRDNSGIWKEILSYSTYADHPSKEVATQVAIARALIAIKE